MTRRYGQWAGRPEGVPEDVTHCVVEVSDRQRWAHYYQCPRKRGYGPDGLYCAQHAGMLERKHRLNVPVD